MKRKRSSGLRSPSLLVALGVVAFVAATVAASAGRLALFVAGLAITLAVTARLARERWLQSTRREP
ncbi:hypothetical protein [Streptomyces anthocyanicus]|uniref:hypothetical protein n=1 Tax=Streptomyces anthocyanicus TaxID=68174 RepID=UPI0038260237